MNKNTIAVLLIISMMPAIALITSLSGITNITGNIVAEEYTLKVCSVNADCDTTQVCCKFNGKESGACSEQSKCSQIFETTKNKPIIESPAQINTNYKINDSIPIAIFFGVSIGALFIAIVYFILLLINSNKTHKKNNSFNYISKNQDNVLKEKHAKNIKIDTAQSKLSSKEFSESKNKLNFFNKYDNISEDLIERYIVLIVGVVALVAIVLAII